MSERSGEGGGGRGSGRWLAVGLIAGAGAVLLGVCLLARIEAPASAWLLRALTSRLSIACLAVLLVCGAGAAAIVVILWRAGRPYRTQHRGQDGVAIIEFALALPFLLMLSLLMAQTSLLMVGNVCVHYSAFCAARSACVAVPRDYGENEPRNKVNADAAASGKLNRVKMAAMWALMPICCSHDDVEPGPSVAGELASFFSLQGEEAPGWIDDRLSRKLGYASAHTELEMDPPDDGEKYEDHEDLHVTVRHTFYLAVPYAARIFALLPDGVALDIGDGEYGTLIAAECSLPNEGVQDYVDIEIFPHPDNDDN